jgi:dihydrodipicolinate synthase/N-acetylneuraminate lyase
MVTPLKDPTTLDLVGIERLVEHILAGRVAGLFILGTTGEGPSLSYRLRQELIECVAERVAGRVPLLVGITDTAFGESIALAEFAADAGAQAVVLAAPCYYPASQADLARYVEHVATGSPLPVFLYNMPSHTKLAYELDTLRRLMEVPNVVGLKDSSANMIYFHHVRRLTRARPDWTLLVGPEELLAESVLLGGDGGVCGGANVFPRLYVELCQASRRGDVDRVKDLHDEVLEIAASLYTVATPGAAVTAGLKSALSCWGICGDAMAEPFQALASGQRESIRKRLEHLGARWVPRRAACPVCGGKLVDIRGKLQCSQCHAICETCCEGLPEQAGQ